jgi:membrane protein DedA with SNARE-associated domain
MWETLATALLNFLQEWGEIAIFVIFLLEESGVPLPLPGDLALIWAGYHVASGQSLFVVVLLVVELATLIGASTLYWLGLRGGRPLIVRYGRFLHIDESRLLRVERWVGRRAPLAIFLGRIVPGCRVVTPLVSGVLHVPYRVFLPALAFGTLVNSSFWMGIGFYFGPGVIAALHGLELTTQMLVSVALLTVLALLTWQIRRTALPSRRAAAFRAGRGRKIEAAVFAGLLATIEMGTLQVIVLAAFTELPAGLPERVLRALVSLSPTGHGLLPSPLTSPVAGLLFIPAGILWAIVYALWIERRLHGQDWLKGMMFSLVPTVFSWLVVFPLLGAGPLGLRLDVGQVLAASEVVRHAVYGVALGLTYPVLLLARRSSQIPDGRAGQICPTIAPARPTVMIPTSTGSS